MKRDEAHYDPCDIELNSADEVRLFDHNFFSFVFNLFANVKKVIMVLGHQAFDGSKRILGRS